MVSLFFLMLLQSFTAIADQKQCIELLAPSLFANSQNSTQNFTAYLKECFDRGTLTVSDLERFEAQLNEGVFINPISNAESDIEAAVAFDFFDHSLRSEDLDSNEILSWVHTTIHQNHGILETREDIISQITGLAFEISSIPKDKSGDKEWYDQSDDFWSYFHNDPRSVRDESALREYIKAIRLNEVSPALRILGQDHWRGKREFLVLLLNRIDTFPRRYYHGDSSEILTELFQHKEWEIANDLLPRIYKSMKRSPLSRFLDREPLRANTEARRLLLEYYRNLKRSEVEGWIQDGGSQYRHINRDTISLYTYSKNWHELPEILDAILSRIPRGFHLQGFANIFHNGGEGWKDNFHVLDHYLELATEHEKADSFVVEKLMTSKFWARNQRHLLEIGRMILERFPRNSFTGEGDDLFASIKSKAKRNILIEASQIRTRDGRIKFLQQNLGDPVFYKNKN